MEAKDTVMNTKVNWIAFNQASLEKLLLEQAEISCKAGIKEVVEWIEHRERHYTNPHFKHDSEWQAKLKEWEL